MRKYILTRLNEYCPDVWANFDPNIGIEDGWLKHRMKIFNEYTIPSVNSQTDSNFIWIIKCHYKTPKWAMKILKSLNAIIDSRPYYEKKEISCNRLMCKSFFSDNIKKSSDHKEILTINLDSDDFISKYFVERLSESFELGKFVDFKMGVNVYKGKAFMKNISPHHASPFYGYCESTDSDEIKTVFHKSHHKAFNVKKINDIGWGQVCHDYNIFNKLQNETKILLDDKFVLNKNISFV